MILKIVFFVNLYYCIMLRLGPSMLITAGQVSRTSFYLRVGALVFGLGTLIFNGLEIAMHATMNDKNCVDNIVIAHPILQV